MGRNYNPIEDSGPIGQFAQELRDRKGNRGFRHMKQIANCSAGTLSTTCNGEEFPSWEHTRQFVLGCGADESEIRRWRARWEEVGETLSVELRTLGKAMVAIQTESGTIPTRSAMRVRPVKPDLADWRQCQPHPEKVRTFPELILELKRLKIVVGNPTLGELAVRVHVSRSTLCEVFNGRRKFSLDLHMTIVSELHKMVNVTERTAAERAGESWVRAGHWRKAWVLAENNRERPDLARPRQYGDVVFLPGEHEGPSAGILETMPPEVVAALLTTIDKGMAGSILAGMEPARASSIIRAMEVLYRPTKPSLIRPSLSSTA